MCLCVQHKTLSDTGGNVSVNMIKVSFKEIIKTMRKMMSLEHCGQRTRIGELQLIELRDKQVCKYAFNLTNIIIEMQRKVMIGRCFLVYLVN